MRIAWTLKDNIRRLVNLKGRMIRQQFIGREVVAVTGSLRIKPDYDDAWVLACAKRAEVVLDAGSNVGHDAMLMLLGGSVQRLIAVDASQDALAICAKNLIFNRLSQKAVFVWGALTDRKGDEIEFWTDGAGAASSIFPSHAKSAFKRKSCVRVPTITLDSLCEELAVTPDFAKVDIEGAEARMLVGGTELSRRHRTRFLVEVHSNAQLPMQKNVKDILGWCDAVGYKAWYLKAHEELTDPAQVSSRGRFHALLQPASWPYPDWLRSIPQGASVSECL